MPGPAVPATGPLGGACGGDGWDGGPLTGQQAAGLGAGDRAGDPEGEPWLLGAGDRAGDPEGEPWLLGAGDWAGDRTGGEWLGGLGFEPWDDEPDEAAVAGVLPGLMPRQWGRDGGFGAGGVADRVPPGPVLAGLAADKHGAGLAVASDDELAGLMIAWRRLGSWAAAGELAAVAELDGAAPPRRPRPGIPGWPSTWPMRWRWP